MCMARLRGQERGGDGALVDALFADHDETAAARFVLPPRAIELAAKPLPDALHQQPHRLARNVEEALHAQDFVLSGDLGEALDEGGGIGDSGQIDDECVEIVMIVALLRIVMRGALREIVFGRGLQPEQNVGIDPSFLRLRRSSPRAEPLAQYPP